MWEDEVLLWIIGLYFVQKQWFDVKNALMYQFITNMHLFTSQDVNWRAGDYLWIIVMF